MKIKSRLVSHDVPYSLGLIIQSHSPKKDDIIYERLLMKNDKQTTIFGIDAHWRSIKCYFIKVPWYLDLVVSLVSTMSVTHSLADSHFYFSRIIQIMYSYRLSMSYGSFRSCRSCRSCKSCKSFSLEGHAVHEGDERYQTY